MSLLAVDHAGLVLASLRKQLERDAPSELDGAFAIRLPVKAGAADGLSAAERAVLDSIDGVASLEAICQKRAQFGALQRLCTAGFVMLSRVTPSDASHVARGYDAWNAEAARLALALLRPPARPARPPRFRDGGNRRRSDSQAPCAPYRGGTDRFRCERGRLSRAGPVAASADPART